MAVNATSRRRGRHGRKSVQWDDLPHPRPSSRRRRLLPQARHDGDNRLAGALPDGALARPCGAGAGAGRAQRPLAAVPGAGVLGEPGPAPAARR